MTAPVLQGTAFEVLEDLLEYGPVTPRLLSRVYGARSGREGRGYWHLQRVLRELHRAGYANRARLSVPWQHGSGEHVLAASPTGARLLRGLRGGASGQSVSRDRLGRANLSHALAVSALHVTLATAKETWTLADFTRDEREGKRHVCPDAIAVMREENGAGTVEVLFEVDIARKNNHRIQHRFDGYFHLLSKSDTPRAVVMLVASEAEVERLLTLSSSLSHARCDRCFLWNFDDWLEQGGASKSCLRDPHAILSEKRLATLRGDCVSWNSILAAQLGAGS